LICAYLSPDSEEMTGEINIMDKGPKETVSLFRRIKSHAHLNAFVVYLMF